MFIKSIQLNKNAFRMAVESDYYPSDHVNELGNSKSAFTGECNQSEIIFFSKFKEGADLDLDIVQSISTSQSILKDANENLA